jgi:hypothetical protein
MPDYFDTALYFEARAARERRPEERARSLAVALRFRGIAAAEAKRFIRQIPKRPAAASVARRAVRKRA